MRDKRQRSWDYGATSMLSWAKPTTVFAERTIRDPLRNGRGLIVAKGGPSSTEASLVSLTTTKYNKTRLSTLMYLVLLWYSAAEQSRIS